MVTAGCPSEEPRQKTVSCYGGERKDTERNYGELRLGHYRARCIAPSQGTSV